MRIRSGHVFLGGLAVVFDTITSPSLAAAKQRAVGALDVKIIEHSRRGGAVSLHTCRRVRLDLPGGFRHAPDGCYVVHVRDEWDAVASTSVCTGVWEVIVEGVPLVAGGTLRLESISVEESNLEIAGDVLRSSPFASERLAVCFGRELQRSIDAEAAYIDGLLSCAQPPS